MFVKIRRATEDDVSFLGWAIFTAARSQLAECPWSRILGISEDETRRFLVRVSQTPTVHWCHVSTFWIADVDGEPAAAMSGFAPVTEGTEVLACAMLDVAELEFNDSKDRITQIGERLRTAVSGRPDDLPEVWAIENVVVLPTLRGRGLVDRLFEWVLDEGREKGFDRAQISCLIGNLWAQRAWERNGFEVVLQQTSLEFDKLFGAPGVKLLARDLWHCRASYSRRRRRAAR